MQGKIELSMQNSNSNKIIQSLKSYQNSIIPKKVFKLYYGNQIALINEKVKNQIDSKLQCLFKGPKAKKDLNYINLLLKLNKNNPDVDTLSM